MSTRVVDCFARWEGDRWTAICLDFDIAVEALTLSEVVELMQEAVTTYVEAASKETPANRKKLLNRRSPLLVRLRARLEHALYALRRHADVDARAGFSLPCPA